MKIMYTFKCCIIMLNKFLNVMHIPNWRYKCVAIEVIYVGYGYWAMLAALDTAILNYIKIN